MRRLALALIAPTVLAVLLASCTSSPSSPAGASPTQVLAEAPGRPAPRPSLPASHKLMAGATLGAVSAAAVPAPAPPPPPVLPGVPCQAYPHGGPVVPLCHAGSAGLPADALVTQIADTNLVVNQAWADTITRLRAEGLAAGFDLQGAKMQGLDLGSHRSAADQQELVDKGFPAAPPGRSMHEWGLAVDWSCNGKLFGDPANAACRRWMRANAPRFGLQVLGHEPWHWSTNGK